MSFGKDNSHLAGMPVYGGSYTQRAANAGRKKERNYGNRRPYWADGFRPSETQASTIRLIPGDYEITRVDENDQLITEKTAWYEFVEHYSGTHRRGAICSGGPWFFNKNKRNTCYGCDKRDSEPNRKGSRKSMSRSDKFVFTTIDEGLFHQVQQVDRESGRARVNTKTQEPYLEWVKCTQRGCQNCHVAYQHRYGYIQPWVMSKSHFNALNAYAPQIGTCCVSCGGRQTIQSLAWLCGNPQCRQLIFDMRTTTASDEQIAKVVNEPYGCRFCQQKCYAEEVIHCVTCAQYNRQPVRATIFDVDLQVKAPRTGENDTTVLQIVGMSDPKPLDAQFQDLLQYKPDLKKRFTPSSLEEQSNLWPDSAPAQQPSPGQPGGYLPPAGAQPPMYAQPYGQAPAQYPMAPQPVQQPLQPVYPQQPQQQPHFIPQFTHTQMGSAVPQYPTPAYPPSYQPPQPVPNQQQHLQQQPQQPFLGTVPTGGYYQPPNT